MLRRLQLRRKAKIATLAASFVFMAAAPASAVSEFLTVRGELVAGSPPDAAPCVTYWAHEIRRARACFAARSDSIWVNDLYADGWMAGGIFRVETPDGRQGVCFHNYGASSSWAWAKCDMDFRETSELFLAAARCNEDAMDCKGRGDITAGWWLSSRSDWIGPLSIN